MRPERKAELAVNVLLWLGAALALGFVVVYAVGGIPNRTQVLGGALGLSLLSFAAALILVGKRLVPDEEHEEAYPVHEHPEAEEELAETVVASGSRFSRRGLFKLGLAGAGGALGLALITPAASFGPLFRIKEFFATPWRRGRRLVDGDGHPIHADHIAEDALYYAFPEGVTASEKEQVAAPLILVRLPPSSLRLPADLHGYDAGGIVAYSKICTHAGCAITLYRAPLFQPDEPKPAFVCPCHYSTFDPADGGRVLWGPAGRRLPMLPIYRDRRGYLRAKGSFDEAVGPSWWGVRNRKPT